jgi:phosphoserine aminotransferase
MMTTTKTRVHNFGAGPAALPLAVLEQVQEELLQHQDTGMSVMELSHRSKAFGEIIGQAAADLRSLLDLPAEYDVLFLQGGASLQFAMVPANLRPAGASTDYVLTGSWSRAAIKEAEKGGPVRTVGSTESSGFDRIPAQGELDFDPQATYAHFTSNNTIYGTQWPAEPEVPAGVPLVCDASSDVLSRPIDIRRYGLLYAGAQKNLGPAGIAVVVIRKDLLERTPGGLPALMDYRLMAEKRSMYNTPPTFAVYVMSLVLRWIRALGGLAEMGRRNQAKADLIYRAIDDSAGFYRGHAQPASRSRMNVTFRLPSAELETEFLAVAAEAEIAGLKGHRSVGGIRASIYNACSMESVGVLVELMTDFKERRG